MQKIQYLIIALLCAVVQGAWAQTEVGTADELRTAIDGTATNITLTADMTVDKHLTISRAITIDLGGFTLKGNSTALDGSDGSFSCIFIVAATGELILSNGTLADANNSATTNAEHSAGAIVNKGTTTLTDVNISNCKGYNGGAINNHEGASLTITSCNITGNTASYCGGAIYNKGTVAFNSGSVSGSTAPYGGAIYNIGSFTMADGTISNCNSTTGGGGGIVNIGTVNISSGTFTNNTAQTDGGAIWNGNSGSAHGTLTMTGGSITGNIANRYGGGIWTESTVNMKGKVIVNNNTVSSSANNVYLNGTSLITCSGAFTSGANIGISLENYNRSFTSGYKTQNSSTAPGTYFQADNSEATLSLDGNEVSLDTQYTPVSDESGLRNAISNGANIKLTADINIGDAITVNNGITVTINLGGHTLNRNSTSGNRSQTIGVFSGGTLYLSNGTVTGGWGGGGGGMFNEGTMHLTNVTISGNTADDRGGGLSNNGTLTMTGCTVSSNTCRDGVDPAGGGGIFNYYGKTATLTNCTIEKNTTEKFGGGGICNYGTMYLNSCTLTENTATTKGGGIWNGNRESYTGTLYINGCTITDNSAGGYGDGIYIDNSTLNMQGLCTVTGNTDSNVYLYGSSTVITVSGAFTSGSSIGMGLSDYGRKFTSGFSTYNSSAEPGDFFSSDYAYYTIGEKDGEAYPVIPYVERSWEGGNTDGHVVSTNKVCTDYSQYNGETDLYNGWYVITGNNTYNDRLACHNDVKFILLDGYTAEFTKGIHIDNPKYLTIYGQTNDTGKLKCSGSGDAANAAIGGNKDQMSGHLIIHGGTVEASSSENNAAAIGGGDGSSSGMQSVTIYGGTVKATGKSSGAGIGSGQENSTVPSITIYGGNVTATGGNYAAGIGGGEECSGGTITIYKGTINATGGEKGAGIGGGEEGGASTITIYNGNVTATGGNYGAGIGGGYQGKNGTITIYKGTVNATGGDDGAGIGAGFENDDAGLANCTVTIYDGNVTATGGNYGAGIGGYASATVNIYGGTVKAHGMTHSDTNGIGIGVRREGGVLNFHMTDGEVTADVKDSGTSSHNEGDHVNGGGAGIGGDYKRCVELHMTIDGGTLTANGGTGGAGIGGGSSYENVLTMVVGGDVNSGSDITINGGTVTATGSSGGAGIGAGSGGNFHCTVTINDGTVTATSGWNGAGIGGGHEGAYYDIGGNGGDVIINGGKVTAYAYGTADDDLDNDDAQAIGHGQDDEDSGTLTIADNMCVKNDDGTETYSCDERVDRCRDLAKRIIEVCTHSDECESKGAEGHTVHCDYCALNDQTEAHTYRSGDDACTKCGYNASGFNTVTIYMANADGSGYDDGTTTTVQYGSTYTLPDCTSVPDNTWFVGWKQTTDAPSSIQADDSEFSSLKSAGSEIEVKSNLTYYARYHSTIWPGGGNGTADDPYLISTEDDWNRLANDVSEKNFDFSGRYFKMTANIIVSQSVGSYSDGKNFRGTFDGDGHTLNVTLSGTGYGLAPFRSVRGATIKNLHVSGTVTVSSSYAGGLIGVNNGGTANITNCRVSVTISKSTQINTGGIVGYVNTGTVNFTGCIFDGTLSSKGCGYWGGFVGYINASNSKIIITDCLFKPESINVNTNTSCNTFSGTWHTSDMTISNGFYTQTCGTARGTQAYTVESGTGLTLDYGSGTHYGEITAYNSGLLYDGKLYTGGTTKVYFTPEANFSFTELEASNGETLTANSNGTYTLTMESKNVTITAAKGTYELTLYDGTNDPTNTATIAKNRDRIADVTISGRTLYKDYNWNTLCLPFDMTAEQVTAQLAPSALMELDVEGTYTDANGDHQTGFDDGTLYLYFKDATKIKAGVPYIVKWDGNTSFTSPTFTSVTINSYNPETVTSDDGNVSFIGNYDPVTLEAGDKSSLYLGSSNKLYYPNAARPINSFRAYFQLNNGITADDPNSSDQNTPLVRAFVLNFGDDGETTGIVGVEHGILNIEHSAATGWYDLSGRKLSGKPTKKGIYIYNGKKRVIK